MEKAALKLPEVKLVLKSPDGIVLYMCYEDTILDKKRLPSLPEEMVIVVKLRSKTFFIEVRQDSRIMCPTHIINVGQKRIIESPIELEISNEQCLR